MLYQTANSRTTPTNHTWLQLTINMTRVTGTYNHNTTLTQHNTQRRSHNILQATCTRHRTRRAVSDIHITQTRKHANTNEQTQVQHINTQPTIAQLLIPSVFSTQCLQPAHCLNLWPLTKSPNKSSDIPFSRLHFWYASHVDPVWYATLQFKQYLRHVSTSHVVYNSTFSYKSDIQSLGYRLL